MNRPTVVVIGAGSAGLAAAHRFTSLDAGRLIVLESSRRLGGKISAVELDGRMLDAGPESFITRNPAAIRLCEELGLGDELVAPAPLGALIWVRNRLRPLPKDLALGVPRDMRALATSGAISPLGLARAALEGILPVKIPNGDLSVGELVRRRFGNEVFEAVVDPLLSGIYAGNADRLSAESVVPHLVDALRQGRSLMSVEVPTRTGPPFLTLRGGLGNLVDAIAGTLPAGSVRLGEAAVDISRHKAGYGITLSSGQEVQADAIVLATPPHISAALLKSLSPPAARLLAGIESVPVATIALQYPQGRVTLPAATGFLVPRREARLLVGCTFLSQKWPELGGHGGTLIRCAVGREGSSSWRALDDDQLLGALQADLREITGITAEPEVFTVRRFDDGIPQYHVGHKQRVEEIEGLLEDLPGFALAGAAYHGVGLPSCIAGGRLAAEKAAEALRMVVA
ncbi:MAG TPA: protoporphyrinogen oxidase [Candidatus Baltobacterales bacterium]|nr:protoporphyrinogen oxidase [Candidatus Baltobacterales bacterium]